ncbi:MAG: DUF2877 domain-containing protein [Humibacillus sp.]|nr:DUF2877 domain-containing protein [Humibacillus sp.]MDN5778191.1 DUF2877 domain-containing protein [Humibacillus sp.]
MDAVRGLAADNVWRSLLTESVRATVVSSFDHAVNLELDGSLLTLVAASGRPAPGALVTDAPGFPRLAAGTSVEIGAGWVRCGSVSVDATNCRFFSCEATAVDSPALPPDTTRWRDALLACAVPGSFVATGSQSPFDRALHLRLVIAAQQLQHALGAALTATGTVRLDGAVGGLVGLGVGLTPSGDDYLVGSLAALHHLPPAGTLGPVGPVVVALDATVAVWASGSTAVSEHFLRAGAEGRFHHDVRWAATAALSSPGDVTAAFEQVAAIGSTSGTDVLHGLVDTLSTCLALTQPDVSDVKEIFK